MCSADTRPARSPDAAPRTLQEAFARHARREGVGRGIRLLDERGRPTFLAYSDLLVEGAAASRALDRAGLRRHDRVMILLPTCRTLITTIIGCILRGIIPFPGSPGELWSRREDAPQELLALARQAGVRAIIAAARRTAVLSRQLGPGDPRPLPVESLRHAPAVGLEDKPCRPQPEDAALLVGTAGPGSQRRPVLLTQRNLVSHLQALGRALRMGEREILCGFAGLDTTTGLVDQLLFGLFFGFDQVLLAPEWVASQPLRWIRAISDFRGTLTLAEDTAYGLAAHRLHDEEPEAATAPLDLASLRRAVAIGTTVRPGTQEAFLRRFGPHGLAANVFLPAYGLAEASGILTIGRSGARPLSDRFDRRSLCPGQYVHTAGRGDSRGRLMMSSGMPLQGQLLRIVGVGGEPLDEGMVGRIQAQGSALTPGIDGRDGPDAEDWLQTGDIGFVSEGELFVIGSQEEGFELNGLRYDPEELEVVAGEVPGIRQGGVAAFTVDEEDGEKPVVV
ncbi:MAG: fatty acyl-AMP ligase, partial [Deltaproteobacteria bacterium]|nr:fatty acyl-AMP ligase [Deltaproteobacteria bacterium]